MACNYKIQESDFKPNIGFVSEHLDKDGDF